MNRIKINSIISVFVLLSFFACIGVTFSSVRDYKETEYNLSEENFTVSMDDYIKNRNRFWNMEETSLRDFVFGSDIYCQYPHIVAVYDENANLIIKSDFSIRATPDNQESKIIYFSDYISYDVLIDIKEYANSNGSNVELFKVDYCVVDSEPIPVNIYLMRSGDINDYKKFKITDYAITGSYYYDIFDRLSEKEKNRY